MDSRRFDAIARSAAIPATRRSALGALVAGGVLGVFGLGRTEPAPVAAQGQGGLCVLAFAATVRQGPSTSRPLVPGGAPGELRGYLRFAFSRSGDLQTADLLLDDGSSLPVVGQATGHGFQARIDVGQGRALVAVGVGEQDVSRCLGRFDGPATGPEVGDLGEWHATAGVQNLPSGSGGSGGSQAGGGGNRSTNASTGGGNQPNGGSQPNASGSSRGAGIQPNGGSQSNAGGASGGGSTGGSSRGGGSGRACPQGQTRCGDACVDMTSDPANCGACGERCAVNNCTGGVCGEAGASLQNCAPPFGVCGDACVDLSSDALNCGRCGNTCPAGEECFDGSCRPAGGSSSGGSSTSAQSARTCPSGQTLCGDTCVDVQTDKAHCGQCDHPCASELGAGTCIDGVCTCRPGTTRCDDVCVNTDRDPLNCGTCGNECPDDQECLGGVCESGASDCPQGQTRCSGVCVDLKTDPDNCGTCGNLCQVSPEIFSCEEGVCVPPSCDPLTDCGGLCVDLQTDSLHCGACGAACPAGETCVGGTCAPGTTTGCPEGQVQCGDVCRNGLPTADGGIVCSGGGAPPMACPPGQSLCNGACYVEGACQPADCPPGFGRCYGYCKDFMNDPGYCGSCSNACPGGICSSGVCTECAAGLTPCGTACVDTTTDLANCGFCGNACGTQCINGQCTGVGPAPTVTCPAGQTLCGDACVDLATDSANCGRCGVVCSSPTYCAPTGSGTPPGICFIPAEVCFAQGMTTCGEYCADTETDPNNCGGCYSKCGEGSECQGGLCTVPSASSSAATLVGEESLVISCPEGQVDCGGVCTDLSVDPLNCGGCFNACAAEDTCQDGQCYAPEAVDDTATLAGEESASSCPEGQVDCGGYCADVFSDPYNCGGCDVICGPGSICDFGVCTVDPAAIAPEDEDPTLQSAPAEGETTCVAAGDACDPASPGACCSGVCNDDGTCA